MNLPSAERLGLLYRLSQMFNSSLDLDTVLNQVMDQVIAATRAERGFLVLGEADGQLAFRVARGMDQRTIDAPDFQVSRGLVRQVADEGQPCLTSDALADTRLSGRASIAGLALRSVLCVPLQLRGAPIGAIYVDNRLQAGLFTQDDLDLLSTIAASAAIAIDNARLFHDAQLQLQKLRLIHDISEDLASTLDLETVLSTSLQRVRDSLGVATASILTVEGDELVFQVATGDRSEEVKPFRIPMGKGIAGWVAQNAQGTFTNDARNDPRFYSAVDDGTGFTTAALMAAPLIVNNRVIGVIEVSNKAGSFTQGDLNLLSTIARTAAMAIENARLFQVAVEKGRIERELQVAREVQASLIPLQTPQIAGWDIAALWQPARVVSGDFYDFIPLNVEPARTGKPTLTMVLGDVSDKGMPAALFMALARSTLRASATATSSPAECITRANRVICADAANGMFVSLFYAELDPTTGTCTYVNAGHNPPLLYRAGEGQVLELTRTGLVLGIDEDFDFRQQTVQMQPGDFMVLYTDGVTDATDGAAQSFGDENLRRALGEQRSASAAEIVGGLERAIANFAGPAAQFDDITVVVAKRLD